MHMQKFNGERKIKEIQAISKKFVYLSIYADTFGHPIVFWLAQAAQTKTMM